MNKATAAIIAALMILGGIAIASGAPGGAETDVISSERGEGTASQTADLIGGNVTAVNVEGQQNTGRWGGFFGNISGGIQLGDSTMGLFYEWTVTDFTDSYVYVASDTVSDWGTLAAASATDQPSYLQEVSADNWTNTFSLTGSFSSASVDPIAGVAYVDTYDGDGVETFRTWSLLADSTTLVYAGQAINAATGFDNSTVDYQILAPASASIVSYQFYLELP